MADPCPTIVYAIVPFAEFGGDDLLLLQGDGFVALPSGSTRAGERVLDAASRIVLETTGLPVTPGRVVYLLESPAAGVSLGVLCDVGDIPDDVEGMRGEVVGLAVTEQDFEPMALREVLVEDLRSGFVRPVAHVVEVLKNGQRRVEVSW